MLTISKKPLRVFIIKPERLLFYILKCPFFIFRTIVIAIILRCIEFPELYLYYEKIHTICVYILNTGNLADG